MEQHRVRFGEVKFAGSDDEMAFAGYGAVFGNVDSHGDVIAKGAFTATLAHIAKTGVFPSMLSQHGGGLLAGDPTPIGVWTELREDDVGLYARGVLAPTERGREAYQLLKMKPRPAIDGLSIGFIPKEWAMRARPEEPRRTLKSVELLEISLVTFPSNPKARVHSVKSLDGHVCRAIEERLKDELKLSNAAAVSAVAIMKRHLREGDEEPNSAPRDEGAAAELRAMAARVRALRPS
ncbi:Phage prohead protease, HK97 family [Hyphomicrobiales bacterium]|nr:HK97 family phage prohead protease [Hyphomicrobiales bacterium]CAH1667721.1 Phage prohead protease, HK97 family [Hyphomicrobiales bacterium]